MDDAKFGVSRADEGWLGKVLPIIRTRKARRFFGIFPGRETLALYPEGLVIARHWGKRPIPEECYADDGLEKLLEARQARRKQVISPEEISQIRVQKPSILEGLNKNPTYKVKVFARRRRERIAIPEYEATNLLRALGAMFGDRLHVRKGIAFHLHPVFVLLQLICGGMLALILASPRMQAERSPADEWQRMSGVAEPNIWLPAAMLAGIVLMLLVFEILDMISKRPARERRAKPGKDRSGRQPLRSYPLGLALKLVALAWIGLVFVFWLPIAQAAARWAQAGVTALDFPEFLLPPGVVDFLANLLYYLCFLPGLATLYCGYSLALRDARYVLANDRRKPILYLRSFQDDRKNDLNPTSWLASYLGLTRPKNRFWRVVFSLHPIRIVRAAFGRSVDSAEEQIGLFLRRYGPFVAIGQPGERFATAGASRMYVDHRSWQETVLDLMGQSQLVVLQPAKTEGIWWEVHQTLSRVAPPRIVMCLVNFRDHQDDYETFRLRVEEVYPWPLPRSVGHQEAPTFLWFDADSRPRLATLGYQSPIVWPFLSRAADFRRTLAPVLARLTGAGDAPPQPTPSHRGHGLVAFAMYSVLALGWAWLTDSVQRSAGAFVSPEAARFRNPAIAKLTSGSPELEDRASERPSPDVR
jgi:hypothetical protein